MLKRDRSSEEKQIDRLTKSAIMSLGGTNPTPAAPTPLPYVLYWDKLGRKGQRCAIVVANTRTCRVRFADNFEAVLNRQAIRRAE
jgi:hypothetical protein